MPSTTIRVVGVAADGTIVVNGIAGPQQITAVGTVAATGPQGPPGADGIDSGGGDGTGVWGGITGTIGNQTDLQTALNTKLTKTSNLSDLSNTTTARANLGVEIGTDVEPLLAPTTSVDYLRGDKTFANFNTAVRTNRLNEMATPSASVNMASQRITNLASPVSSQDAVNKAYADALAQGLSVKTSVVAATAAALSTNTYLAGVLTASGNGALVVDGITVSTDDRILVKDEATLKNNGIYVVTDTGGVSTPFVLTRATDMDSSSEIRGAFTLVSTGTVNASSGWVVSGPGPFTLGTTDIVFAQFSTNTVPDATTLVKGKATLGASGGAATFDSVTFTNAAPTPVTVGGIAAGSTFSAESAIDMFEQLLYPYQVPAFSSFLITGQATTVEVGEDITGDQTFSWATTNSSNVTAASVEITDGVTVLDTGLASSGTTVADVGTVTRITPGTHVWTITGENTQSDSFTRNFTVTWLWRVFVGTSTNTTLTEAQIEALAGNSLASTGFGTYALAAGGYKYFCYPTSMTAASSFTDTSTNFDVTMATVADHADFSNTANGLSYAIVSVTNSLGEVTDYRVYRTRYILGGSINIEVA